MRLSIFIASAIELSYAMAQEEEEEEQDLDALVKELLVHVHCFDGSVVRRLKLGAKGHRPSENNGLLLLFHSMIPILY